MSNLPTLTGTDKQIAWAEDIRANLVKRVTDITGQMRTAAEAAGQADNRFRAVIGAANSELAAILTAHTDARWWIDRRPFSTDMMTMANERRPHGTIGDLIPQIQQAMVRAHAEYKD